MSTLTRPARPTFPEVEDVKGVVRNLLTLVERSEVGRGDRTLLEQAERDLTDLFHLVVLGEFNAGKSAALNGLLGADVLETGATPTTQVVQVIRYSDEPYQRVLGEAIVERGLPVPWLRDISLVDTPGTNAIIREHERITSQFVPRADLVLFITSVDRPFTESERAFLDRIRAWGKKVVLILNKIDLLNDAEQREVFDFVRTSARTLLAIDPPIFPVSARLARAARATDDEAARDVLLERSGFPALERYIFETLDDRERLRLKLLSPLGIVLRVMERYQTESDARLGVLDEDVKTLDTIDRQVKSFADEIHRDVPHRVLAVERIVNELNERGDRFFEETVRIGRIADLLRPERVRAEFERDVIGDTARRIDETVADLVDWLVAREGRFWNDAVEYLERRRQAGDDRLVGRIGGTFVERRRDLVTGVGEAARRVVDSFDREHQSDELAGSFRDAIAQTALAEVGAVSLGALIAVLVGTVAADITGVLAAGVLGGLALFILPRRRSQARKAFRERTDALRERLDRVLRDQIERELGTVEEQLRQAIAPYRRFVDAERTRLTELSDQFRSIERRARTLRGELEPARA